MARLSTRLASLSIALVVLAGSAAQAQRGGGGGGGGGGGSGSRDPHRATRMDGDALDGALNIIAPQTLASLVLEHDGDFKLTDAQRTKVVAIRALQDSASKPWLEKLDSLRALRPNADENEDRRRAGMAFLGNLRTLNEEPSKQVMDMLTPDQQKRARELEEEAQKKAEAQMRRRK